MMWVLLRCSSMLKRIEAGDLPGRPRPRNPEGFGRAQAMCILYIYAYILSGSRVQGACFFVLASSEDTLITGTSSKQPNINTALHSIQPKRTVLKQRPKQECRVLFD